MQRNVRRCQSGKDVSCSGSTSRALGEYKIQFDATCSPTLAFRPPHPAFPLCTHSGAHANPLPYRADALRAEIGPRHERTNPPMRRRHCGGAPAVPQHDKTREGNRIARSEGLCFNNRATTEVHRHRAQMARLGRSGCNTTCSRHTRPRPHTDGQLGGRAPNATTPTTCWARAKDLLGPLATEWGISRPPAAPAPMRGRTSSGRVPAHPGQASSRRDTAPPTRAEPPYAPRAQRRNGRNGRPWGPSRRRGLSAQTENALYRDFLRNGPNTMAHRATKEEARNWPLGHPPPRHARGTTTTPPILTTATTYIMNATTCRGPPCCF